MAGTGVIVNVLGIAIGGIIGAAAGRLISERYQETLMKANAIVVLFLGLGGALSKMLRVGADGTTLDFVGVNMMVASFIVGGLAGEIINLEDRMESFGVWLKKKVVKKSSGASDKDAMFVDGFVSTSLTVCIGAMAVIGPINDRLLGDPAVLYIKTVLDFIIVMLMAASMGRGCAFSAISVGALEGAIYIFAGFLEPIMTPAAEANLSYIGNMLIFCVGVNLFWGKMVRVANLLPAIVIAIAWAFLP
ncbi:MAG: DUF554 domain-containing protein [Selenomonadaceae bacterium]